MGILVETFTTKTFKMKTIFVIAILFSISSLVLGCTKVQKPFPEVPILGRGMTYDEAIESLAFEVCDIDSDSGLTWEEVEACEGKYCPVLAITCPDRKDFDYYDIDKNEFFFGLNGNPNQNNKEDKNGLNCSKVNQDMTFDVENFVYVKPIFISQTMKIKK